MSLFGAVADVLRSVCPELTVLDLSACSFDELSQKLIYTDRIKPGLCCYVCRTPQSELFLNAWHHMSRILDRNLDPPKQVDHLVRFKNQTLAWNGETVSAILLRRLVTEECVCCVCYQNLSDGLGYRMCIQCGACLCSDCRKSLVRNECALCRALL